MKLSPLHSTSNWTYLGPISDLISTQGSLSTMQQVILHITMQISPQEVPVAMPLYSFIGNTVHGPGDFELKSDLCLFKCEAAFEILGVMEFLELEVNRGLTGPLLCDPVVEASGEGLVSEYFP